MRYLRICAPALALAAVFFVQPAAAIKLEPAALILTLKAGETRAERVKVTNDTDAPQSLHVEPEYWHQGGMQQPLESWFSKSVDDLHLPAQGSVTLDLKIAPPEPLVGECVVMVFLAQAPQGEQLAIQTRVGFPVYILRRGTGVVRGELTGFEQLNVQGMDAAFGVSVANQGNVHLVPFGNILLQDEAGKVYHQPFHFEQPVFPGQNRQMKVGFPAGRLPAGRLHAKLELFLDNQYAQEGAGTALTGFTRELNIHLVRQ